MIPSDATPVLEETLTDRGGIPRYELEPWQADHGVVAGVTARGGNFDLGLDSSDPTCAVMERWRVLREGLGPGARTIVVSRQAHGVTLACHERLPDGVLVLDGYDGHLTAAPGTFLAVSIADCVPVYLSHPSTGGVGILHAGWRGIARGIVEAGIDAFAALTSAPRTEMLIHCGISICGNCYEVGPEVVEAVAGRKTAGREALDLRRAVALRAGRAGVRCTTVSPWCTAHGGDRFYSHRQSGGLAGRMVAYIGVPAP